MERPTSKYVVAASRLLLLCLALAISPWVGAADPTQPAGWKAPSKAKKMVRARPKAKPKAPLPALQLQGVVVNQDQKIALINNQWLRVNERIDHATVIGIYSEQVVVKRAGKTFALKLIPQTVSEKTAAITNLPSHSAGNPSPAHHTGFAMDPAGHPHGR